VAPATAIAVNMHIYWTGLFADMWRAGDKTGAWVLAEAGEDKVFAAGHGEGGNDVPVLFSSSQAARVEGGWEISGHKIFGSLSPVWDYLGLHAMDTSATDGPRIVHAFLPRESEGYRIEHTWDVLGMRATQSDDTILDRTFIADDSVVLVCPAGAAGAGPFQLGIFAWALLGFAAVYAAIARRGFDLAVGSVKQRKSVALSRTLAYHPEVQHQVAAMRMKLELIDAYLERTAADWATGVDHGMDWVTKIFSTKYVVVTNAFEVVDRAMDLSGGAGIFRRNRLEQLFRDCRLGRIHPANEMLTHEIIGKLSLGINPDEMPRWG
jgi:alkylation response protein AidB-like acyl-CoA dehydrogenase